MDKANSFAKLISCSQRYCQTWGNQLKSLNKHIIELCELIRIWWADKICKHFQGYRLDFYQPTGEPTIWNGSSATVIEDDKHTIWGAVYEIDLMHLASLDAQEGVHIDKYVPLIKEVVTPNGEILECRLYQMTDAPTNSIDLSDQNTPHERKPSKSKWKIPLSE